MSFLLLFVPASLAGQQLEGRFRAGTPEVQKEIDLTIAQEVEQDHVGRMVLSGALAGAVGMGIGWYLGREITDSYEGGFLAAAAVESAAVPLGVHWGNGSRGELPLSIAASYGLGFIGVFLVGTQWTDSSVRTGAVLVPLVQLLTSTWFELEEPR